MFVNKLAFLFGNNTVIICLYASAGTYSVHAISKFSAQFGHIIQIEIQLWIKHVQIVTHDL